MTRRILRLTTGIAGLTATLALTVGIPWALITFVGWPLPAGWPDLDQLQRIGQVGISDATVIKVLAVIVWVTWAQLALAIGIETLSVARRRAAATLPLLPGLQPLAARLVATIALLATVTTTPRLALALPLDAAVAPAVATQPADHHTVTEPQTPMTVAARPAQATRTVVAGPRDSWWSLAEQHTGDGLRWRELRDLNLGRTLDDGTPINAHTDQLRPGWSLLVPADPTDTPIPSQDEGRQSIHTVERGDHLWGIAEEQLADTIDGDPDDSEVAGYWRDLIDANRDRLLPPHDPDVIYPGQELVLPPTADWTDQRATGTAAPSPPAPAETADPAPTIRPHAGWQRILESHGTAGADAPATEDIETSDQEEGAQTAIGVPVGLAIGTAAAALAATGIVATLRWRRRRALAQRMPGLQLPTLLDDTRRQLANLDAAAIPAPILDDLASLLSSIPTGADPVLVSLHDDATVVLLFDDTAELPDPPAPWELHQSDAGPVGWHAAIGDRGPQRSVGLPLLVTLGRTGTTTVLANLAAIRHLTLHGPDALIRQRLRAISLEAATSRIAAPLEVVIAGDHRLASLEQVRHIDDPQTEIDAALDEIDQDVIPDDRTYRLIACHHATPAPPLVDIRATNVGIISTTDQPAPGPSAWRLHIDGTTGSLELPDGGTVDLTLPDLDPDLIDDELTRLDHGATATAPTGVDPASESEDGLATEFPDAPQTIQASTERSPVEPAWCEVQILGNVQVIRNGQIVDGLTPKTLELLAYLATHRDGTTNELLADAVWAGRAARGTQRIRSALTKLRDTLGDGPDGQPLIPRRTDGSQRIRLSNHVGCDLDRALAHLARAADLPAHLASLEQAAALDLVRAGPFRDMPTTWTTDITQRAIVQLQDTARELAITARQTGDHDLARLAIQQGLELLDPCDALYLEWAELERARGRTDRIPSIWEELRRRHAQDADEIPGLVSLPAPQIELAFQELMAGA